MGPDRDRHLINALAIVVALNIVGALVVVYARSDGLTGGWARGRVAAETVQAGSILAGGNFTGRRISTPSTEAPATSTTTEPPTATTTEAPTTTTTTAAAKTLTSVKVPKPVSTSNTAATAPRRTRTRDRTAAAAAPAPGTASRQERARSIDDPAGDTFVDRTDAPLAESRADIGRAGAAFGPDGIAFHTQVDRPTDPRQDERWAGNSTFALWAVDTNGDTIADYEIRYFLADAHNVGGYVSRPGEDAALCSVSSATYTSGLYGVTVDPACLGNPSSFTFRASMYYETNPDDASATIAADSAPDKGWSPPVTRPSN